MEKCYDPRDTTLRFVDREDELDFLCEGFKSRRALMSCGHAVTPMSLTNWCRRLLNQCPGCRSSMVRKVESNLNVRCPVCTRNKGKTYEFCWQCLREWKGPAPRSDRCQNEGCFNDTVKLLNACPDIIFESVKGVSGCPSIRACPTCGLLVEHNKKKCKNIICPQCMVEFCFVCLKLTEKCQSYFSCSSGVAPRQTSIPVWKKI
ncbi:probable E3 ubiquitin-protein ligase ARI8 [Xiphias gladius]|uniref:probable E3 ubiquitin-protein ligase ARI8 n=1 Tax=Xiphias gladius TaxID=8245 RepID=UPI001A99B92B|nr:probable E3 ubiquitin-protein ligase ARI8 [Xiphias gladius]